FSASADKSIMVNKKGRSTTILPEVVTLGKQLHGMKVRTDGPENPSLLRLVSGELVLDEQPYDPEAVLKLDELMLGEGPNRVRAVAIYSDGMEVSSPPINFGIKFNTDS
ncbi:MAG: hypothetical protein KJN67_05275, partial [Pontiella sp.]|nr:hypothetical protein [Pontiella sp.]